MSHFNPNKFKSSLKIIKEVCISILFVDKYPYHHHHSWNIHSIYHILRSLPVTDSLNIQHSEMSTATASILHTNNLIYRDIK